MAKVPGMAVYHGRSVTMTGDGTATPGDFVAINSGKVTTADSTTDTNVIGVLSDTNDASHSDGDEVSVYIGGVVIGNVASGATAGTELGASATEGEAGSGSGAGTAFSDEGGSYKGATLDAGYAAVHLE